MYKTGWAVLISYANLDTCYAVEHGNGIQSMTYFWTAYSRPFRDSHKEQFDVH